MIEMTEGVAEANDNEVFQSRAVGDRLRFNLPIGVSVGSEFSSFESLRKFLKKQADKFIPSEESTLFVWKYDPNRDTCRSLSLTCRREECQFGMRCSKVDRILQVESIQPEHTHLQSNASIVQTLSSKKQQKEQRTSVPDLGELYDNPPTTYPELERTLKKMKYGIASAQVRSSLDSESHIFLFVSEMMRSNYNKYPEIVHFDILNHEVRGLSEDKEILYRLGIFYVFDTNLRMLLIGCSVFELGTVQELYECFTAFFKLHMFKTLTLITPTTKEIRGAVEMLRQYQPFNVAHVLDPWHVISNIPPKLTGSKQSKQLALKRIRDAIFCRNLTEYTNVLTQLIEDEANKDVYDEFINNSPKICYCELGDVFVGVQRFSRERIGDALKEHVSDKIHLSRLVIALSKVERALEDKSKEAEMFKEQIEVQFKDLRIREVREVLQGKLFLRFLENYVIALEYLTVTTKNVVEGAGISFELFDERTSEMLALSRWKCTCQQYQRTGIPCPHLIACARTVEDVCYSELVHRRWKREGISSAAQAEKPPAAAKKSKPSRNN